MSENSHIDKFFKEGIGEMNFSGPDAAWQKMDAQLDKEKNKKRRFAFIISSVAVLLLAGGFLALNNTGSDNTIIAENKTVITEQKDAVQANTANKNDFLRREESNTQLSNTPTSSINKVSAGEANLQSGVLPVQENNFHTTALLNSPDIIVSNTTSEINTVDEFTNGEDNFLKQQLLTNAELLTATYNRQPLVLKFTPPVPIKSNKLLAKKETVRPNNMYSIDLIGGTDALRMNRKAGYYAGVRVTKKIDEGVAVSLGLSYTNHTVKDNYRRTTKPVEERRADFKLMDMSMIRMPIYFHRQVGQSRVSLMAGLVPSYVIDAEIYNVPTSFNGNPSDYNKFSIKDINRFNVLFGAGIKYAPLRRVAIEVSGSYGFTGLVKDGYRNQSRTLDNFKSIQAGLVLNLK